MRKIEKKNKRGQFFTIAAILLLSLMFLSFEVFSYLHQSKTIQTRVSTMNSFLDSVELNLERQLYISGFRILFLVQERIVSTGNYIVVDDFFQEAFFNGTVNGIIEGSILPGATYDDLIISLNEKANKINVNITLNNSILNISQSDPWNVNVSLVSNFVMEDIGDLARWEKIQVISVLIPIGNFEDPLYTINSNARISKKINKTIYEGNYVNGADVSNLSEHVSNNLYSKNINAPSFLMRLEGNLSSSIQGVESFVNLADFAAQGITTKDKSTIDYIYFSSNNPSHHAVVGMPSWFRIDSIDGHYTKYGV